MSRIITFVLFLLPLVLTAQNPGRTTIRGTVQDTTGAVISYATVMLLNPVDTTLINFTRSDDQGAFSFKNVKNNDYLLKISYIGYLPYQMHVSPAAADEHNLGALAIKPISQELMEVVIKTAKAPLYIRGDTIEYDATTFKVPPGSSVEDLLRRLPGIEVDADGNIRAQGRDVKRVYVDGKVFFSDDPKAATKNLDAETISKVQVYNEQSEQARLTGVDDGKKEKALNLELKEEFKKGAFGKLTAAAGSENRWAGRGNYNRFNPKQQLSFIGYGNNINQTGINWEDYGEFKGQNTFDGDDNGDFGFSSGGGRVFYFGGEDTPLNNYDGRGLTKNFGGGTNFNYDHQKTKFNFNYFYNQTALDLSQQSVQQTFFDETSFQRFDTVDQSEFRGNHSIGTRFEQKLDSNNILIVKGGARFGLKNNENDQSQLFFNPESLPNNRLQLGTDNDFDSWRATGTAIFRHRFRKKGRSFAVSGAYNNSTSTADENVFSLNRFFLAQTPTQQIRQLNLTDNATEQVKSSALFTEPLTKRWFWETFYNFNSANYESNRQVRDEENGSRRLDSLSLFFDNDVRYQRVGSSIRYSHEGLNASVGLAGQEITLNGTYAIDRGLPALTDPLHRRFRNWIPNVDFSYEFTNNMFLNLGYSYGVSEPQITDLQPVPNVSNPLYRIEGNPLLSPERSNRFEFNFNYWNPASFANIGIGGGYTTYDNQIVYNQLIETGPEGSIITTQRPDNVSGGRQFNSYLWSSYPIIKTKLTVNANLNVNINNSPAFVNNERNDTRSNGYGGRVSLNFTPTSSLFFSVDGNLNFNDITYSINTDQNQEIRNYGSNASLKWQFAPKTFLESNFNYSVYVNERFGFNTELPILNGSVRQLFGPSNKLELRLSAFDLFNRRVNVQQYGQRNFVANTVSNTLARYFMLSLSYNMRGYENKLSRNNWW